LVILEIAVNRRSVQNPARPAPKPMAPVADGLNGRYAAWILPNYQFILLSDEK
jgi:hypothetical protein